MGKIYEKEAALKAVEKYGNGLNLISENFKNDKDVVLAAVAAGVVPCAFKWASKTLRNDKDFVMQIIEKDGLQFKFASARLRSDKNFVLDVVKVNGSAFYGVNTKAFEQSFLDELVIASVNKFGEALECASDELKNDKDVVLTAVKNRGEALMYASDELKNDKEVVTEAVKNDAWALFYTSDELKNNKEFIVSIVNINPVVLYFLHYSSFTCSYHKYDKDILYACGNYLMERLYAIPPEYPYALDDNVVSVFDDFREMLIIYKNQDKTNVSTSKRKI